MAWSVPAISLTSAAPAVAASACPQATTSAWTIETHPTPLTSGTVPYYDSTLHEVINGRDVPATTDIAANYFTATGSTTFSALVSSYSYTFTFNSWIGAGTNCEACSAPTGGILQESLDGGTTWTTLYGRASRGATWTTTNTSGGTDTWTFYAIGNPLTFTYNGAPITVTIPATINVLGALLTMCNVGPSGVWDTPFTVTVTGVTAVKFRWLIFIRPNQNRSNCLARNGPWAGGDDFTGLAPITSTTCTTP